MSRSPGIWELCLASSIKIQGQTGALISSMSQGPLPNFQFLEFSTGELRFPFPFMLSSRSILISEAGHYSLSWNHPTRLQIFFFSKDKTSISASASGPVDLF